MIEQALIEQAQIIATVNDRRATAAQLRRFVDAGATMLRLNGAFLGPARVEPVVAQIRGAVGRRARIILDLPGYKVRFLHLESPIRFKRGVPFNVERRWLNYPEVFDLLRPGTVLRINDGRIVLTVEAHAGDTLTCLASQPGAITPGKGLHLDGQSYRPSTTALSALDLQLVEQAVAHGVDCLGLSFPNSGSDVTHVQELCGTSTTKVIPKIESKESVKRLGEIVELADEVIIDRGDLSGEIGIDKIWRAQREIIGACKRTGAKVYAATQVLASMVEHPLPSIAEIDSLYSLMHEGIDGIQLSEETSVGRHAVETIRLVRSVLDQRSSGSSTIRAVAGSRPQ